LNQNIIKISIAFNAKRNQNKIENINKKLKDNESEVAVASASRLFLLDPRFFNKK